MKPPRKVKNELYLEIARAVDRWYDEHPKLTIGEIVAALEKVRGIVMKAAVT